ncbi:hypothetical protein [Paenibacillus silvisoli]|uniref:hypothetical protein n=1 Tax=Paenibacillus silvisoli TaxID=3110539 RepID=UPI002804C666|nr:hypothetical protein [Paenibacillus silvisoli]
MKKTKLPGDNISLKTKKSEDPLVMAWLNMQTNLMDSFRYLVENEIMLHGVRNLQMFIPAERTSLGGSPGASAEAAEHRSAVADARQETAAAVAEAEPSEAPEAPEAQQLSPALEQPVAEPDEIDEDDIESWS